MLLCPAECFQRHIGRKEANYQHVSCEQGVSKLFISKLLATFFQLDFQTDKQQKQHLDT